MGYQIETVREDGTVILRASSTPDWQDCDRRGAARSLPTIIAKAGYDLCDLEQTIGAVIGTSVHTGAKVTLSAKLETGKLMKHKSAEELVMAAFSTEMQAGVIYDPTSPNWKKSEAQVRRMFASYILEVAPFANPIRVERRLEAKIKPGFVLSGQADAMNIEPDKIDDLKTGVRRRANVLQLGCYGLLARSWGMADCALGETYIARVPMHHEQPAVETVDYDSRLCQTAAARRVKRTVAMVEEFAESGDAQAFPANPASQLCSDRYCPAWGTNFCKEHKT